MKSAQNYIGYVYLTTNLVNGKQYVGQHLATEFDKSYKGSGHLFLKALSKYGWDNFKCEIICWCNNQEELDYREQCEIAFHCCFSPNGYNLKYGGNHGKHSNETRKKISEANKGRIPWNKGIPCSENTKKKISESNKNPSEKTRKKMSNSAKGKTMSDEARKKMSKAHKGQVAWNKGKTGVFSEEARKKMSESKKGKNEKFVCPLLLCYKYYKENKPIDKCRKEFNVSWGTIIKKLEKHNLTKKCK